MQLLRTGLSAFALVAALTACGIAPPGGHVHLGVSASRLTGVSEACYTVREFNSAGALAWSEVVCSGTYGNGAGGDVSYVGTCDALHNPNRLTVSLDVLKGPDGLPLPATSYTNPCPPGAACEQAFTCASNKDVLVSFNLTILVVDPGGFVDVAVNLDGISCSAKGDCNGGATLPDPANPEHQLPAAVVALSCSAPADKDLSLYLNDLILRCVDGQNQPHDTAINPGAGPGLLRVPTDGQVAAAAAYSTSGLLAGSGGETRTLGWAVAVALDPVALGAKGVVGCKLLAKGTGANKGFSGNDALGYTTPGPYPVINYSFDIASSKAGGNGLTMGCNPNPLNGDGSGVTAQSVPTATFKHELKAVPGA